VAARHLRSVSKTPRAPQSVQTPQESKSSSDERITVARILRPHGVRGEVAAEILTDFPERLKKLKSAELWDGKSEPKRVAIRSCWLSHSRGGQAVFHFEGSDSMTDAEKLTGLEVQIPLADRMPLPSSSYYISDLIGCEVFENVPEKTRGDDTTLIGLVRDVQFAGTPLLVVNSAQGELLIPLAQDICVDVDTAARRIEVILPEGLRGLNP
jgi:16S rRNA processing protein RimM